MEMWMYQNKTDERYIDKDITEIPNSRQTNVYLKDKTNITDPIIIMDDFPKQCNYVWLSEFDRYYYVRSVDLIEGQMHVTLHVDVLTSFKTSILSQECIISRASAEGVYNLWQADDKFKLYEYTQYRYKFFQGGNAFNPNIQNFVLCVMGADEMESEG